MRLKTTINGQLFALKLLPVIFLAVGFASALQLWHYSVETTAKSEHQNAVFTSAQLVVETMLEAQTSVSGYVATTRTGFLEPYDRARLALPAELGGLATLAAGDSAQMRQVRGVEARAARELRVLAREIALTRGGHVAAARAEAGSAAAARTMDDLRGDVALLEAAAQRDAITTLAQMKAVGIHTLSTLLGCTFFAVVFAAAAAWRIRRSIRANVDALVGKAQRLARGEDIGPRLSGGKGDFAELECAFHDMAELLAERTGDLERYRLLAERTQCVMLFARQRDGRILHANTAALGSYGYTLAEMRERTVDALRAGEIPAAIATQLATPSHDSIAYEADQRRSDGSTFPAEVTVDGSRVIAGENVQLSIVRDISERKAAEALVADALGAAQNAARAKAQFLATMSHEIRTPMNAVIGMTELVLQTELATEQREALQIVSDSGAALLRIIDDVLDFSKIEAGKLNVEIIEFPFAKTIESVAVTLAAQARARGLTLSVFVDPKAPATLYGDAGRIRQVLTNLAGNALKFTHAGSVMLTADVTAATKEWCEVRFSVADTGIGIAPENLARIFQPFAQADASTTRVYGGSGLGLSICQQLVELMGGDLRVVSAPERGSTFSFVLRLRAGQANVPIEPSGRRALVVDASGETASDLTRYLRAWGIDVFVVASAPAAIAACTEAGAEQHRFDVAIFDADWLGKTACSLGAALTAEPRSANIRLILVASSDVVVSRAEAMAAGFDAYFVRPLRQSQIFDCIMHVSPVPASPRIEPKSEQTGHRILLAEDNLVNQRVALKQLYKLGYEATVVGTGRAALAAVIGGRFDLVLMDCFMPEMDGYAATGAIRRHQARTGEQTPIIAMTANAQADDRSACIAAGMDDYLAKPVTLDALRATLERYIAPSRETAAAAAS